MRLSRITVWMLPLMLLAAPAALRAQTTGSVSGVVVTLAEGAPVAGAVVTLVSLRSPPSEELTTVSDRDGAYEFALLPPGPYQVGQQSGCSGFVGVEVHLDAGAAVRRNVYFVEGACIDLLWGGTREDLSDPDGQTRSTTLRRTQLNLLPYGRERRNFERAASAAPGTRDGSTGLQIRGSNGLETRTLIDGLDVGGPFLRAQGTSLPLDLIDQLSVDTEAFDASLGRATGGVVRAVTPAPFDSWHGTLFGGWMPLEARRGLLATAGTTVAEDRSLHRAWDAGVSAGGPLVPGRLSLWAGIAPQTAVFRRDRLIRARRDDGTGRPLIDPTTGGALVNEVARQTYESTERSLAFAAKLVFLPAPEQHLSLSLFGNPTRATGATGASLVGNEGTFLLDQASGGLDGVLRYGGTFSSGALRLEAWVGGHLQTGAGFAPDTSAAAAGERSAAELAGTPQVTWGARYSLIGQPRFDDGTVPSSQRDLPACAMAANGFDPCPAGAYRTGGPGALTSVSQRRLVTGAQAELRLSLAGVHRLQAGVDVAAERVDSSTSLSGGVAFSESPSGQLRAKGSLLRRPASTTVADLLDAGGRPLDAGDRASTSGASYAAFVRDRWRIADRVALELGLRVEQQSLSGDGAAAPQLSLTSLLPRAGLSVDLLDAGRLELHAAWTRAQELVPLSVADVGFSPHFALAWAVNPSACIDPRDPRTCAVIAGGAGAGRTFDLAGGVGLDVAPSASAQTSDELSAGLRSRLGSVRLGLDWVRRWLSSTLEDFSPDGGATYLLGNPAARRLYDGVTLRVERRFDGEWLLAASYTLSSLRGDHTGLDDPSRGVLSSPNLTNAFDLASLLENREGPLPGDATSALRVDAAWSRDLGAGAALSLGAVLRLESGQPVSHLGASPIYGRGEAFILPRGSAGRLPWLWQADLRASVSKGFGGIFATVTLDVYNVTNNRAVVAVDQDYTYDAVSSLVGGTLADLPRLKNTAGSPVTLNPTFRQPTALLLPLAARLGARVGF